MDKIFAEVAGRPFYVVTAGAYNAYVPQYDGDVGKIYDNIGPEVGDNAWEWINYYWDQIWK